MLCRRKSRLLIFKYGDSVFNFDKGFPNTKGVTLSCASDNNDRRSWQAISTLPGSPCVGLSLPPAPSRFPTPAPLSSEESCKMPKVRDASEFWTIYPGWKGKRSRRGKRKRGEGKPEIKTTTEWQKPKETPELPLKEQRELQWPVRSSSAPFSGYERSSHIQLKPNETTSLSKRLWVKRVPNKPFCYAY